MAATLDSSQNYTYLAIAAFFGFLGFMMQPTAYTWGEQDMMPFFERVFDPSFLANDFFTNTTITKNPRWIYGYFIVALSWFTTLPWYKVLYLVKLLLLTLTPVLYFKVLMILLRKYVDEKALSRLAPFVLICLVLMVFLKEYRYYFSVASWLSYTPALHAYNFSIVLCFVGILFKELGRHYLLYIPFFFLSCLVHPAMGLFAIGFYAVFLIPKFKKELRRFIPVVASAIVAAVFVKFMFAPQEALPTAEFVDIYVEERHSWHYKVSDYINRKGNWVTFFALMNALFVIPLIYGLIRKRRTLWLLSLCSWCSYSGAIAAQYFFIDVFPVKLIAYLGVSRFTTFGYWMLVIVWAMLLSDFIKKEKLLVFPSLGAKNFAILIINLIFVGIIYLDNPREAYYNNRKGYYDFVQSTPEDAIFVAYSAPLNTDMRIVGRRSVFVGDEFPFAENYIAEYGERYRFIYGTRQKKLTGIDFYRSLKPEDFVAMSKKYRLDYIVIENGFASEFGQHEPVWKNHRHRIYRVKTLDSNL